MSRVAVVAALALFLLPRRRRHPVGRRRKVPAVDAAEYFDAVAAELRRGASLRQALALPAPDSRLARLAGTGQPIELVAAEVQRHLGLDGELAPAGIRLASRTGAPAAVVFARLAARLRAAAQLERDRRALTAQARLSAAVVGLVPVALGVVAIASGRIGLLLASSPARQVIVIGVALQLAGLAAIGVLLRSHR